MSLNTAQPVSFPFAQLFSSKLTSLTFSQIFAVIDHAPAIETPLKLVKYKSYVLFHRMQGLGR